MPNTEYQNLGIHLKNKRNESGYTQNELAKLVKVHTQYVSNWERGTCAPPTHCFKKVLAVLNIDKKKLVDIMLSDYKRIVRSRVFDTAA